MHRAETIMQAVVTAVTGLATTGTNVERSRVRTIETLPALTVMQGNDDFMLDRSSWDRKERDLEVQIDIHVKNNTNPDSDLNQIRAEVYAAIAADWQLGQTFVIDVEARGDDEPEFSGDGEKITARQRMNFVVKYRHSWDSAEA